MDIVNKRLTRGWHGRGRGGGQLPPSVGRPPNPPAWNNMAAGLSHERKNLSGFVAFLLFWQNLWTPEWILERNTTPWMPRYSHLSCSLCVWWGDNSDKHRLKSVSCIRSWNILWHLCCSGKTPGRQNKGAWIIELYACLAIAVTLARCLYHMIRKYRLKGIIFIMSLNIYWHLCCPGMV